MADSLSWASGPTNSRGVRVLLYLAYGSAGSVGILLLALVAVALSTGSVAAGGGVSLGVLALALLLAVWRGLPMELARRSGGVETNALDAFRAVRQWRWVAAASLLAFGVFTGVVLASGIVFLALLGPAAGWLTGYSLAHLLSSTGEVDPETRTMTYEGRELDLDALVGIRRIRFGGRTFLWLSFEPGYSAFDRRLYVLPTSIAERSRSAFEIGVASDGRPTDTESESANRERYLWGTVAFSGAGIGAFAIFWWAGAPLGIAALAGAITSIPALALFATALQGG